MFCRTEYFRKLRETAFADELAKSMLGRGLENQIAQIWEQAPPTTAKKAFKAILEGMEQCLAAYPAPPYIRQRYWDACKKWTERLAKALAPEEGFEYDFADIPRPVVEDTAVALVKALHDESGRTKKELADLLGVSEKTIQSDLRALDPELREGGKPIKPLRFGGQAMRVKVKCTKDGKEGERRYHTEDRLHPVALQLNTMQALYLLLALKKANYEEGDVLSREMAKDVWSQLSEEGRQRVREVSITRDEEVNVFLDDIQAECDGEYRPAFRTEAEMREYMDPEQQLMSMFKSCSMADLTIERDGKKIRLRHVRLRWDPSDRYCWVAEPADKSPGDEGSNADARVRFRSEEVRGYVEFYE